MELEFGPAKDVANLSKHGLSLARAAEIDLGSATDLPDHPRDYAGPRFRAYGMMDGKLHMVVFTPRAGKLRIISLPRANARERKRHG